MTVEFRCEKCGKLLSVEVQSGEKVRCQYCNAKVAVPAGLASLPRPQVAGGAAPATAPQPDEQEQLEAGQDVLMDTMAKLMPWVISAFLHVGILVILAFFLIVESAKSHGTQVIIPAAKLTNNPGQLKPTRTSRKLNEPRANRTTRNWSKRNSKLDPQGQTMETVPLFNSLQGSGASASDFGMERGGKHGPRAGFMGEGGNCHHIVLVVDRSGSMLSYFDAVRQAMRETISQLQPEQTFHVVFFAREEVEENPPRRLVDATKASKREAFGYLDGVRPQGGSPTNPLKGLERAFNVLAHPPNDKQGKLLFLLTDGEFENNDEVRKKIKEWNKKKDVFVYTIFCGSRNSISGGAGVINTLKQIANENGGVFKFKGWE